jgi:hypothetical protein
VMREHSARIVGHPEVIQIHKHWWTANFPIRRDPGTILRDFRSSAATARVAESPDLCLIVGYKELRGIRLPDPITPLRRFRFSRFCYPLEF